MSEDSISMPIEEALVKMLEAEPEGLTLEEIHDRISADNQLKRQLDEFHEHYNRKMWYPVEVAPSKWIVINGAGEVKLDDDGLHPYPAFYPTIARACLRIEMDAVAQEREKAKEKRDGRLP